VVTRALRDAAAEVPEALARRSGLTAVAASAARANIPPPAWTGGRLLASSSCDFSAQNRRLRRTPHGGSLT
jgi:hypothetical protein